MIKSFHFLCVEIHLSLFCTLSSITIHMVCPACCLDPGTTVLRMCQAWLGIFVARQFHAFCTTWRVSELLQNVLRDFHVSWHWAFFSRHEWCFIQTQNWTQNVKQYISQYSRGAHGEPLIASKSSIVVSRIAITALDLITRPSSFLATMCSSVWKRSPGHVPRCRLSVMTPSGTFPTTLNITAVPKRQEHPTIVSQWLQISSALLDHPTNGCSFQWHHMSRHHASGSIFRHQDL